MDKPSPHPLIKDENPSVHEGTNSMLQSCGSSALSNSGGMLIKKSDSLRADQFSKGETYAVLVNNFHGSLPRKRDL